MYASLVAVATSWSTLTDIDRQLQHDVIAKGCPLCGGPLHVANHPRKPRGLPPQVEGAWSKRFNTCCGHCRRRCMPPSVRFLGRRVYAGVIVMLSTMFALVCEAASKTQRRWQTWWRCVLPAVSYWTVLRAGFVPAVQSSRLPASLLERYEPAIGEQTLQGLINTLRALAPITTSASRDMRPTLRIPDFASIEQAPERSILHVLSAATRCGRLSIILEHRDLFDGFVEDFPLDDQPCALDLAARQLVSHMEELIASLDLYEIALQARRARLREDDILF